MILLYAIKYRMNKTFLSIAIIGFDIQLCKIIIFYLSTMNRDKAPGQKECDEAIDKLNMNIRDLDQASLRVLDQNLQQQTENSLQVI